MTRSRLIYAALLIAAFIFSQALYDSISLFTLAVVLLIPLISLLCLLISLSLVKIKAEPAPARVARMSKTSLRVVIRSKTPLMLPMMKFYAYVSNPQGDASVLGYTVVNYRAFGQTVVDIPLQFNLRGLYKVGLDYVEFYDFLRLFRIKRRLRKESYLTVAPRNLKVTLPVQAISREQENTLTAGGRETKNGGDLSGIREFNEYDTLRQVHWKLSAKTGKLILREPMQPERGLVLLTMNLRGDAWELDRKFGRLLWLGSHLLERDVCFQLRCLTGEGVMTWEVNGVQGLREAVDKLLCSAPARQGDLRQRDFRASWQYHIGGEPDEG